MSNTLSCGFGRDRLVFRDSRRGSVVWDGGIVEWEMVTGSEQNVEVIDSGMHIKLSIEKTRGWLNDCIRFLAQLDCDRKARVKTTVRD